jgi:hypothetical protein
MSPHTRELAERLAEQFINAWDDSPSMPGHVILATYESQLDYETLRPEDQPARFEEHTAMIHHIKTLLDWEYGPSGPEILTPTLNAADYLRWLAAHRRTNDAAARAEFIASPPLP